MTDSEALLAQELDYYRARAPEYDEWFFRRGRYDRGPEANAAWAAEAAEVAAAQAQVQQIAPFLRQGVHVYAQFRRDVLGVRRDTPISPKSRGFNGQATIVAGTFKSMDRDWIVLQHREDRDKEY